MIGFAIHSDYPPVNLAPVNMAKSTILDDFPSYKTFRDFPASHVDDDIYIYVYTYIIEGSLEVKLPTIWTDEKQSREEAERRERSEERRVEEKE